MITVPTTELIGCLSDVLPIIGDEKSSLAGVRINWDGEALHFTTYDTYSGGTVEWVPGEGAEGGIEDETSAEGDDLSENWGGDDAPWDVWIWLRQAKDIINLFKLPAKLWRFPVTVKCSPTGDRLTIEREDGPKAGRLLMLNTDNGQLKNIPNVRAVAAQVGDEYAKAKTELSFAASRIGAFGSVRPHGSMKLTLGIESDPVAVRIGGRYHGFIYPAGAKNVLPYSLLRDGSGLVTGRPAPDGE